jgi:hypothetical protein
MTASGTAARLVLRLVVAAGLAIDAYVHFHLAHSYDGNGDNISQGDLFRIEAAAAAVTAVLVLVVRHRLVDALAFLVAAGGVAAVLVYRYVDVPAFGPFPAMYEPLWYTEKTVSLIAEAVAAVAAAVLVLTSRSQESERAAV